MEISRSKGSDYYFGKSLKKFKDLPDFQAKYRQRFLEVMHSLDLAELEHLAIKDDSGSDFIKTGFNPKFYENFLSLKIFRGAHNKNQSRSNRFFRLEESEVQNDNDVRHNKHHEFVIK